MLGQSSIQVILWQWEQSQDLLRCTKQAGLPELTFAYHIRCQFAAKKVSVFRKPIICCCQIRWRYRAKHFSHQPWPFGHKQSLSQAMLAHFKCMNKSYACLADHFSPFVCLSLLCKGKGRDFCADCQQEALPRAQFGHQISCQFRISVCQGSQHLAEVSAVHDKMMREARRCHREKRMM